MIKTIKEIENEKCCKKQDWEQMSMDFGGETDNRIYIMYKCTQCWAKTMDIFIRAETIKGWEL